MKCLNCNNVINKKGANLNHGRKSRKKYNK